MLQFPTQIAWFSEDVRCLSPFSPIWKWSPLSYTKFFRELPGTGNPFMDQCNHGLHSLERLGCH